jgi:hypothetical protein
MDCPICEAKKRNTTGKIVRTECGTLKCSNPHCLMPFHNVPEKPDMDLEAFTRTLLEPAI